jgi:hypothetical protein
MFQIPATKPLTLFVVMICVMLMVHCHKEANDDYGYDHERMKEHVWSLLTFAIFTQNNVSSFAIVVP